MDTHIHVIHAIHTSNLYYVMELKTAKHTVIVIQQSKLAMTIAC